MPLLKKTIIFDVDSTLCTIEGIDELARMRRVEDQIQPLTEQAMNGEVTLDEVFSKRLDIIKPSREDLLHVGELYTQSLTENVENVLRELQKKSYECFIVSGGYLEAIIPLGKRLSIPLDHIFANSLIFGSKGEYQDFDRTCPLWREDGKKKIIEDLNLPGNSILVGDGMSDAEAKGVVTMFIGFGGVKERAQVKELADFYVKDMRELLPLLEKF